MKVGKIKKTTAVDAGTANNIELETGLNGPAITQNITLEEVLQKTISENPSLVTDEIGNVDPVKLNNLVKDISFKIAAQSRYDQVLDTPVYRGSNTNWSEEEVAALKRSNRLRVGDLLSRLDSSLDKVEKELEDIDYYIEYDSSNIKFVTLAKSLFPSHTVGILHLKEIRELKKLRDRIGAIKAAEKMNKYNRKTGNPVIDLNKEFSNELDASLKYSALKAQVATEEHIKLNIAGRAADADRTLAEGTRDLAIQLGWDSFVSDITSARAKPIRLVDEDISFPRDLLEFVGAIEEDEALIDEKNLSEKVSLIPLQKQLEKGKQSAGYIRDLLGRVDEQNSYISGVLGGNRPVNIKRGKNGKVQYDPITIEDCWKCFKLSWDGLKDFSFGLDVEYDAKLALDNIEYMYSKINYAFDLPYLIRQNVCSLVRLGSLCPIELAFILSSFLGLAMFTWKEMFSLSAGGSFLKDLLFNGLLKPILGGLQVSLGLSLGPLPTYKSCISTALTDLQSFDNTLGSYGFKVDELSDWLSGKVENVESDKKQFILQKLLDEGKAFAGFGTNGNEIKIADDVLVPIRNTIVEWAGGDTKNKFWATATNPLLGLGGLDALEMIKGGVDDFAAYASEQSDIVKNILKAIEFTMKQEGDSIVELAAKLAGLGTCISLIYGIFTGFKDADIDACIKMEMPNGAGSPAILESPFTIPEIAARLGIDDINYEDNLIPDNSRANGSANVALGQQAYLYNPLTDKRFNLTNCDRAKSSIISKGESLEFWKRIALGANVDNV
ncbi:MAG: hypothetical protein EB127_00055 [Alphaproteobacteria bacterium]|nr:hypothetical protein [Alphaproteobacteria bacterium]